MTILDVLDKVERGDYRDDRFPLRYPQLIGGRVVEFTYKLDAALQHAQVMLSQQRAAR